MKPHQKRALAAAGDMSAATSYAVDSWDDRIGAYRPARGRYPTQEAALDAIAGRPGRHRISHLGPDGVMGRVDVFVARAGPRP